MLCVGGVSWTPEAHKYGMIRTRRQGQLHVYDQLSDNTPP